MRAGLPGSTMSGKSERRRYEMAKRQSWALVRASFKFNAINFTQHRADGSSNGFVTRSVPEVAFNVEERLAHAFEIDACHCKCF